MASSNLFRFAIVESGSKTLYEAGGFPVISYGIQNAARKAADTVANGSGDAMWRAMVHNDYGLDSGLRWTVRHDLADMGVAAGLAVYAKDAKTAQKLGWAKGGIKPHDIHPVNKKALFWAGARHPVAWVHHPGVPARGDYVKVLGDVLLQNFSLFTLDGLRLQLAELR